MKRRHPAYGGPDPATRSDPQAVDVHVFTVKAHQTAARFDRSKNGASKVIDDAERLVERHFEVFPGALLDVCDGHELLLERVF